MKQCTTCGEAFVVREKDLAFLAKIAPVIGGRAFAVPPPTRCPDCRTQRRLAFRNERTLYQRTCGSCGRSIIAVYSPDKPYTVYCSECWWSDKWDGADYAREIDFSRSFLDQYLEVLRAAPRIALANSQLENSSFVNQTVHLKNCYLIFSAVDSEDCYYGMRVNRDKNCVDSLVVEGSELAYECLMGENLYDCQYAVQSTSCNTSRYLFDCQNCSDCLMCWNLRGKQYYVRNQPLTKDEYQRAAKQFYSEMEQISRRDELRRELLQHMRHDAVHRAARVLSSENSIGDNLYQTKNVFQCFQAGDAEDCAYSVLINFSKDTYDTNNNYQGELAYETSTTGIQSSNVLFCTDGWPGHQNVYYSNFCPSGHWLLGCSSMKRGKYAILNRSYGEEEFGELFSRVVELMTSHREWGEFPAPGFSSFGYNETPAQEHFPLSREDALAKGFSWCDFVPPQPAGKKVFESGSLPERLAELKDEEILDAAIRCEASGRLFRIVSPELAFYRKFDIPLPRKHPDVRHNERMALCNPRRLWQRKCGVCRNEVFSSFEPGRPEAILCESCYEREIY